MRNEFFKLLHERMAQNKDIFLVVGDLGFGLANEIRDNIPERFINTGAAEAACSDICVGLALSGKIPVMYSITPFLIYRCFETWRTYVDHEKINIKLVGSGRDDSYKDDGFSHDATDVPFILGQLTNIEQFYPEDIKDVSSDFESMIKSSRPSFISLQR